MENKIYIRELSCYQRASEKQKEALPVKAYFDLELLPSETMKNEVREYIFYRDKSVRLSSIEKDRMEYQRICGFLKRKRRNISSFWGRSRTSGYAS